MYLQYIWHLNFWDTHERLMLCDDDTEGAVYVRPGDMHALRQALGVLTCEPHPCILPGFCTVCPSFFFSPSLMSFLCSYWAVCFRFYTSLYGSPPHHDDSNRVIVLLAVHSKSAQFSV